MRACNQCGIELILPHEEAAGLCLTCMMIEQQEREVRRG